MNDDRKNRLINEAVRDLCAAIVKLSRAAPSASWHAYEAVKEARREQLPKPYKAGQLVEVKS